MSEYQFVWPPQIEYPCKNCERQDLRTVSYALLDDFTPCGLKFCPKKEAEQ